MKSGWGILQRGMAMQWIQFLRRSAAVVILGAFSVAQAAAEPLPVEGTRSVFQRVLTLHDAVLFDGIEGAARSKTPLFSVYYVFKRTERGGVSWVQVGPSIGAEPTGWMRGEKTLDWRHAIVLSFTDPARRRPVMFFEDRESLAQLVSDSQMSTRAEIMADALRNGTPIEGGPVAMEPEEYVSLTEQFYLLPVLEAQSVMVPNLNARRFKPKAVKVASIPLALDGADSAGDSERPFQMAVMFVVDTTSSMGPYIERSKTAIKNVYEKMSASDDATAINFGMIGYRDNIDASPGLGYVAKNFAPIDDEFDPARFLSAVQNMKAAEVSSTGYREDAVAGILMAIEETDWEKFDGRYIIHVSDAGMRDQDDILSTTNVSLDDLRQRATDKGVYLMSLYLKTDSGDAQHDRAVRQISTLTRREGGGSGIFPVENGDIDVFGDRTDDLVDYAGQLIDAARQNEDIRCPPEDPLCATIAEDGHAMRLRWLGRRNEASAPALVEAWAADFALDAPRRKAFDVRVLLTKNQLNDLYISLGAVRQAATRSITEDKEKFFVYLKDLIARAQTDPSMVRSLSSDAGRLAERNDADIQTVKDVLAEFLDGLPYRSDISSISLEKWLSAQTGQRDEILNNIDSKLAMYEAYYADTDNWVALHADAAEGDKVYPVPLQFLP